MRAPRLGSLQTPGRQASRRKYKEYVSDRSPAWIARRKKWFQEWADLYGNRPPACSGGCGKKMTLRDDFHHRTYERLTQERFEDLIVMCRLCHQALHRAIDQDPMWRSAERSVATDSVLHNLRRTHTIGGV